MICGDKGASVPGSVGPFQLLVLASVWCHSVPAVWCRSAPAMRRGDSAAQPRLQRSNLLYLDSDAGGTVLLTQSRRRDGCLLPLTLLLFSWVCWYTDFMEMNCEKCLVMKSIHTLFMHWQVWGCCCCCCDLLLLSLFSVRADMCCCCSLCEEHDGVEALGEEEPGRWWSRGRGEEHLDEKATVPRR